MNRIYKTLKNFSTGAATAVSENQRSHGKRAVSKFSVVMASALMAMVAVSPVHAVNWTGFQRNIKLVQPQDGGISHVGKGFAFGDTQYAAKEYGENLLVSDADYQLTFSGYGGDTTCSLNLNSNSALSLFDQSKGFTQKLVEAKEIKYTNLFSPNVSYSVNSETEGVDSNIFIQNVQIGDDQVATARYLIGERAKNIQGSGFQDDVWRDGNSIVTGAILSELQVLKDKTLAVEYREGMDGKQTLGAHLTGEGGVAFSGTSRNDDVIAIQKLYASRNDAEEQIDHFGDGNDYTGGTTITNVTLELHRPTSLGSGAVTAENANITESVDGALGTAEALALTNSVVRYQGEWQVSNDASTAGTVTLGGGTSFEVGGTLSLQSQAILEADPIRLSVNKLALAAGSKLNGKALDVKDTVTVSGQASIETTEGSVFESGLLLQGDAQQLSIAGGLNSQSAVVVEDGAQLTVAGGISSLGNVTVGSNASLVMSDSSLETEGGVTLQDGGTISAESVVANTSLSFKNGIYEYGVAQTTVPLVFLSDADVTYGSNVQMQGIRGTQLHNSSLTLNLDQQEYLGESVDFSTEASKLCFDFSGSQTAGMVGTTNSKLTDVVEFHGNGTLEFQTGSFDGFLGYVRLSGNEEGSLWFNLNENIGAFGRTVGLSIADNARVTYTGSEGVQLNRLAWTGGILDLGGYTFTGNNPAITLAGKMLFSGQQGTLIVNSSAVSGLSQGAAQGAIFDLQGNGSENKTQVISANGYTGDATLNIVVQGASGLELTQFFDTEGSVSTDSDNAAAKGYWGYQSVIDNKGVAITHALHTLELLGGEDDHRALNLTTDKPHENHQDLWVKVTGNGILNKNGSGELHLLDQTNDFVGRAVVTEGTLSAKVGALGQGGVALSVAKDASFLLTPSEENESESEQLQKVSSITAEGEIRLEDAEVKGVHGLQISKDSSFAASAKLVGNENAVLDIIGGTLTMTDAAGIVGDYEGVIRVGKDAGLSYEASESGVATDLTIQNIAGSGTILLSDDAILGDVAQFTGAIEVDSVGALNLEQGTKLSQNVELNSKGTVTSTAQKTFEKITISGGTLDLGEFSIGAEGSTGMLTASNDLTISGTKVVARTEKSPTVDASNLLVFDNESGAVTMLVKGEGSVDISDDVVLELSPTTVGNGIDADLFQNGQNIGSAIYDAELTKKGGLGIAAKVTAIDLVGELVLNAEGAANEKDASLDLTVTGSDSGSIRIEGQDEVTLAQQNNYGRLLVDENAKAAIGQTQILSNGGLINGQVRASDGAALRVTGG